MRQMYVIDRYAVDVYDKLPMKLAEFTRRWNERTKRNDSPGEVLHYMRTSRKNGNWPRLDGNHIRVGSENSALESDNIPDLIAVYILVLQTRGICSDAVGYDDELAKVLSKEFAVRTGKVIPGTVLAHAITTLRKHGLLPDGDGRKSKDNDHGFGDIDRAVG